jgi:hypothetical protein
LVLSTGQEGTLAVTSPYPGIGCGRPFEAVKVDGVSDAECIRNQSLGVLMKEWAQQEN